MRVKIKTSDFTLNDCLFGGVELAKKSDPDKYIVVMVLDLIRVKNVHYLTMVAWVKM